MTSKTIAIPDEALAQHIAVLGKTRSGKSSTIRGIVEGLLAKDKPVCIIDPKGDWWGLKSSADGKRPGFPVVIFGGEHADVPINAHAGAHIAELVATGNRSCIIDLGGWEIASRTRFFNEFASTLFRLARGTRHVVIDEVHNFAPKGKLFDPDAGKMLHWCNRLASEGAGKGLLLIAASQRPQKVHNDFLNECETLIAMRLIHPMARAAIKDWIDGCPDAEKGKEVLQSLASMPRGTGWVWSPEIGFGPERVAFPLFSTYDSFKPRTGDAPAKLKGWSAVDLDEVKAKLESVVKEATENDPKVLRRRIAELERASTAGGHTKAELNAEYTRGREEGYDAAWAGFAHARTVALEHLGVAAEALRGFPPKESPAQAKSPVTQSNPILDTRPAVSALVREKRTPTDSGAALQKAERKVLTALAQYPDGRTLVQVAVLTGYAVGGGGFRNAVGAMRTRAYLVGTSERLSITPEGLAALGPYDPLPTGDALLRHWLSQLGKAEREILKTLAGAYPHPLSAETVAVRTHYEPSGGGFRNALGS